MSKTMRIGLLSAWLLLVTVFGLSGCQAETVSIPAPPPASALKVVAGTSAAAPATTPPAASVAALTTTPSGAVESTTASAAAPTDEPGLRVEKDTATLDFPDTITFSLEAENPQPVKTITLEYGTDKHSLTDQTTQTQVDFEENSRIAVSWDWQMKKTGSLPPGAKVWWQWRLTDLNDETNLTPRQSLVYTDPRFDWQVNNLADLDLFYTAASGALVGELSEDLQAHLSRMELNVSIPEERKPRVFVYASSEELKGAMLFEQEWTGAVAYSQYNIVLTAVNKSNLDWAKEALPHEITHLLVREAVFGPFGDIPTWLSEGLAEYSEGDISRANLESLKQGAQASELISVSSLGGSFPANSSAAHLAYLESRSLVSYLIEEYGWEKMRELLAVFKDGATYDKGLQAVYGFDIAGLEAEWKAYLLR